MLVLGLVPWEVEGDSRRTSAVFQQGRGIGQMLIGAAQATAGLTEITMILTAGTASGGGAAVAGTGSVTPIGVAASLATAAAAAGGVLAGAWGVGNMEAGMNKLFEADEDGGGGGEKTIGQILKDKLEKHADEYPDIDDAEDFADHIDSIVMNPSRVKKGLERGREAYWGEDGTVVIFNPKKPELGTAFRPDRGIDYFEDLE